MRPVFFFPHATIIDCGASRTILAVISGGRKGRLRLEKFAAVHHVVEPSQDGNWLTKTAEALTALHSRVKPSGPVTVVLPPHLTLMKMFSTPRVAASKRDKIINFESQQSIPYPLSEVVWDRLIAGENSHSFNVLLCAAKLDVLDSLSAAVVEAKMVPTVLLPAAQALAACYRETKPPQEGSTLLVGLGGRSSTMVLLNNSTLQARALSLGGIGVTQHIAERRSLDLIQAEDWKLDPSHAEEIAPSVRQFANRLGQEITRTLGYFNQPITTEHPLNVMLTGGSARLPGLAGMLATQLNVPVTLFNPATVMEISREAGEFRNGEHGFALAELLGAAALQLRAAQPPLNLLPPRLRQQAGRRRLRPWLALAAGLAVAAVVPSALHYHRALNAVHAQNIILERELAPLRTAAARAQENQQRLAQVQRQHDAGLKIAAARTSWLKLLSEIQSKIGQNGDDIWLERMHVAPAPAEPSVKTADQPALRLTFSGLMRTTTSPAESERPENYQRVRGLLKDVATIPLIAAVENERFESASTGLMRFEFVIVLRDAAAL